MKKFLIFFSLFVFTEAINCTILEETVKEIYAQNGPMTPRKLMGLLNFHPSNKFGYDNIYKLGLDLEKQNLTWCTYALPQTQTALFIEKFELLKKGRKSQLRLYSVRHILKDFGYHYRLCDVKKLLESLNLSLDDEQSPTQDISTWFPTGKQHLFIEAFEQLKKRSNQKKVPLKNVVALYKKLFYRELKPSVIKNMLTMLNLSLDVETESMPIIKKGSEKKKSKKNIMDIILFTKETFKNTAQPIRKARKSTPAKINRPLNQKYFLNLLLGLESYSNSLSNEEIDALIPPPLQIKEESVDRTCTEHADNKHNKADMKKRTTIYQKKVFRPDPLLWY